MVLLQKITTIAVKDMKVWIRQPLLIVIAVLPLIVISLLMGLFLSTVEKLPAGVILKDNDPYAIKLKELFINSKSGTGMNWFDIKDLKPEEIKVLFEKGKILAYIIIPDKLQSRLKSGENIKLAVHINNIQDDVTKNVLQRIQYICNHFNRNLPHNKVTSCCIPQPEFKTVSPVDIRFSIYVIASVLALTVILSCGVNIATATAREFEEKTMKELLMSPPFAGIILGKILTTIIQTIICYIIISLEAFFIFGFIPKGNPILIILLIFWGIITFSSIGFIAASKIKKVIPAAVVILLLHILGWWIGGGRAPAELWQGTIIGTFASLWPGTYFYRSFISLLLLGSVEEDLFIIDCMVTGLFGLITLFLSLILFHREAKND